MDFLVVNLGLCTACTHIVGISKDMWLELLLCTWGVSFYMWHVRAVPSMRVHSIRRPRLFPVFS